MLRLFIGKQQSHSVMGVLVLSKSYMKKRQLLVPGWLQNEKSDLNEGWEG